MQIVPSAAVGLAAVLSDEFRAKSGIARVGVILTGGNVDLDRLPWGGEERRRTADSGRRTEKNRD